MEQKLSIFQDFLATLPPAALEVLQLTYDSNVQLTNELEKRKADIKQLRKTHADALQQKDWQLDQLQALVCKLQQQPSAAALLAQQPEQVDLYGDCVLMATASAPGPHASPSTGSAGDLQADHATADKPVASTKKRRIAADKSVQEHVEETGLQPGEVLHAYRQGEPRAKRTNTTAGLGKQDSLAAAIAEHEHAAGATANPEAAAAGARSVRALPAGTYKLAGSNSHTPTKPSGQQQHPPAGQATRPAHLSADAAASASLAPTNLQLVLAAAMQTAGSMPLRAASARGQTAGQLSHAMQAAAERDAGDMSDTEQDTRAGDKDGRHCDNAADLLFFAAADPSTAHEQEPQRRLAIQPAAQNPAVGSHPPAGFDAQEAFATILSYLQKHGNVGKNTARGPSSAGGARGPPRPSSASGAPHVVGGSDGGSAASIFHPASPASAAGAANRADGQRIAQGGMSFSPAGPGVAGRRSAAGAAADLAAASAAAAQAASEQQMGSSMPFGFSGPSHEMHITAGHGHPTTQGSPASLQHMLGSLGYDGPGGSTAAVQHSAAALLAAQSYRYAGYLGPGPGAGVGAAAGHAYGYHNTAAVPAAAGEIGGLWEGWQQMQSMQGGMMGAAGTGADRLMAPGHRSLGGSAGGGSTGPAKRSSKGTTSAASAGDPDDVPDGTVESGWQRELERMVPPNVCKAIREAWLSQPEPRKLPINCNGCEGTFFVSQNKECLIRNAAQLVIRPTQFERDSGKATAKDWQRSIRVPGYEGKNGPIRLGHFVRIVGISTSRRNSST